MRQALASVTPKALDRSLHARCMNALRAGDPVAFCGGKGRVSIRARGFRARSGAHAASLRGAHALEPGTKVTVRGDLGSRKAQLALVYRVGDRHVYVRFSRFGGHARSALVTSRRHGTRLAVRLHVAGRSVAPARQRGYSRATTTSAPAATAAPAAPPAGGAPGNASGPETTSGAPCGPAPTPIPQSDDGLSSLWTVCGPGWTGGDGAYSTRLPDGREVWAFGDTFLGRVNADGSRPADAPMVHNSLVVQDGTRLTTLHGGTSAQPSSLVSPADPASWYWSGTPVVEGSKLYWFLSRRRATGGGSWDFSYQDSAVATFSLPDLRLESVTTVPGGASVLWGAAVLDDGAYTYVYGTENSGGHRYAHVARAPRGQLASAWEYFTGSGWSSDPAASARAVDGVSDAYSVVARGGRWYLVSQDPGFGNVIRAYPATSPAGPWGSPVSLYTTSDPGPTRYTYSAIAHPELSDASSLVVSYDVNTLDHGTLYADVWSYRPRFVRVPWSLLGS
ncbi:MAG: DUF5005 domain-containing protein [Thermoleophilaceae bacterium]